MGRTFLRDLYEDSKTRIQADLTKISDSTCDKVFTKLSKKFGREGFKVLIIMQFLEG